VKVLDELVRFLVNELAAFAKVSVDAVVLRPELSSCNGLTLTTQATKNTNQYRFFSR